MRVLIAAGGTGGHISPGLALADEIRRRGLGHEVAFLGSKARLESRIVPQAGYKLYTVAARGLLGKGLLQKAMFFPTLLVGMIQCLFILAQFHPRVVVGTGGYISAPLVLAAGLSGIPVVLLALDALPSKAIRSLARWAKEIHTSFPESRGYFPAKERKKLKESGNPVREWVLKGERKESRRHFGLVENRKTLLLIGGSQGAHSLNAALTEALGRLRNTDLQVLWQTGEKDHPSAASQVMQYGLKAVVKPFFEEMDKVYAATDFAVGRSGATATADLMACGIPCLLVPFPFAAENHQEKNARWYESRGAARVVLNKDLTGEVLAQEILRLVHEPGRLEGMAKNARACGKPEATRAIVDCLERLTGEEKGV
jgi:UDP-N-acetylglucosamine--N-acetylmuramyl-(pentapeptide) pyrophosphoryl-undecaprenol N-acetylglucosamine transferase